MVFLFQEIRSHSQRPSSARDTRSLQEHAPRKAAFTTDVDVAAVRALVADAIDVTDVIHPDNRDMAVRSIRADDSEPVGAIEGWVDLGVILFIFQVELLWIWCFWYQMDQTIKYELNDKFH